ncbi:MAG: hypothetical protein ACKVGZ_14640, partial [Alphaproteobacteria bacterium]
VALLESVLSHAQAENIVRTLSPSSSNTFSATAAFLAPLLAILIDLDSTLDTCAPGNAILTTLTN